MSKKIISGILAFICSLFLFLLVIVVVLKMTIFNKSYVLKTLEKTNYYEKVYSEIKNDMENNLMSSGLDKTILDGLFNKADVKSEMVSLIGSIYSGTKYEIDASFVKKKLNDNIDEYLKKNNVEIVDKDSLNKFIDRIVKVYEKETSLYGYLDGFGGKFKKAQTILDAGMVSLVILVVILLAIIRHIFHEKYSGVVFLTASMMTLFFKTFVYDKIDVKNILIISDTFSDVLQKVLLNIENNIIIFVFLLAIVGVLLNLKNSFKKRKKRIKRLS